jgi:hypothetical protein
MNRKITLGFFVKSPFRCVHTMRRFEFLRFLLLWLRMLLLYNGLVFCQRLFWHFFYVESWSLRQGVFRFDSEDFYRLIFSGRVMEFWTARYSQ